MPPIAPHCWLPTWKQREVSASVGERRERRMVAIERRRDMIVERARVKEALFDERIESTSLVGTIQTSHWPRQSL